MRISSLSQAHRRYNVLTGEWVLVSPQRLDRPWLGKIEKRPAASLPEYDPECYLCPGNKRANGELNPRYENTYVFDNDFSALTHSAKTPHLDVDGLLRADGESGICRVACFSPKHNLTLAEMDDDGIYQIVQVWKDEYISLGNLEDVNYVQIFENKGEIMGCSNPHPHCQIWAENLVPAEPSKESLRMKEYKDETGECLICNYLKLELESKERVVFETEQFVALVPFWAVWPFEIMLAPKSHTPNIATASTSDLREFASALRRIAVRYDNLFETSFPYSAGIHQSPTDGQAHNEWHFHMHFYPPLLRSATVKKFMVGYEMLANPQRDITAEAAAERLREMPEVHYKYRR